jgi:hypothetical protein
VAAAIIAVMSALRKRTCRSAILAARLAGLARLAALTRLAALAGVASCAACAAGPESRPAPRTEVTVSAPPRLPDARERVDAALARHDGVRAARVELVAAPDDPFPAGARPAQPAASAAGKVSAAGRKVIVLHDEVWPSRVLALTTEESRIFESPLVASSLLTTCFGGALDPARVVNDLDLGAPPTIAAVEPGPSADGACVRSLLLPFATPSSVPLRLRITARLAFSGDESDAAARSAPPSSAGINEELAELRRRLGEGPEPARARPLLLLLGARLLDAARLDASGRTEHQAAARDAFERVASDRTDDAASHAAALFGLSVAEGARGERAEAMRAARSLVCPSRFPRWDGPVGLEHDHPQGYWDAWETMHFTPISTTPPATQKTQAATASTARSGTSGTGPTSWQEETRYHSPYEGCRAPSGIPNEWVTRAWQTIADHHLGDDPAAGPFRDHRAVSALRAALAAARGESAVLARLALGRVLLHQQRPAEVVRALAPLAGAPVDREVMKRAAQLVASALTFVDLDGSTEDEAWVLRPDVFDVEPNPNVAGKKLRVVVERLDDPQRLPSLGALLPLVMRWMSFELTRMSMLEPALLVQERFLARFPLHREAAVVSWEHAQTTSMLASSIRPGATGHVEAARIAAEARAQLAHYSGDTAWTQANHDDPEALRRGADLATRKP